MLGNTYYHISHHGRDHKVVGYTITCAIHAYNH